MQTFTSAIKRFREQGEKTGWFYVEVPAEVSEQIKPGCKKSYRIKGKIDSFKLEKVAIIPMGGGNFIMPVNATIRKAIGKTKGAMVKLQLTEDKRELEIYPELIECLSDEPSALENFRKQPLSHQHYFSKWILSAKTDATKAKRIAMTVKAMVAKIDFGQMLRDERDNNTLRKSG